MEEGVSPCWPYTSFFFPSNPPSTPCCKRWTALYSVSTGPRSQIRELLMELSSVLVYLVASHQVQVSPLLQMDTESRCYELSTQQPATTKQHLSSNYSTNTIFLLLGKLLRTCFFGSGTKKKKLWNMESSVFLITWPCGSPWEKKIDRIEDRNNKLKAVKSVLLKWCI